MDQYEQLAAALRARCPELEIREWEPMARHTTSASADLSG